MKPYRKQNRRGFTIVELVIVIAVIAILASVLIPTFSGIIEKANYSNAFQEAENLLKADAINYTSVNGGSVPDDTVYEVNGYYFKVVDNALVRIDEAEYKSLNTDIKNIIFLIPDGAGFGTYDIANAYKKAYSGSAVNGVVDGIKDDATHTQGTTITTNAIEGKTVLGLYLDEYMIATADTSMKHAAGHSATDSAAAGTALLCGQKTDYVMCGITPDFSPVANILELARLEGKATGAVSTKCSVDATTTVMVAHSLRRPDQSSCAYQADVSAQILNNNIDIQLMYGTDGGRYKYATTYSDTLSVNSDTAANHGYTVVTDLTSLNSAVASGSKKIFSNFQINYPVLQLTAGYNLSSSNYYMSSAAWNTDYQAHHTLYDVDCREGDITLMDMAKAALTMLSKNVNDEDGFCLVIEGGAIDNAAEGRNVKEAVAEYLAFDEVFGYCVNWAMNDGHTIVIACPDHDSGGIYNPATHNTVTKPETKANTEGTKYTSLQQLVTALHDGTVVDNTVLGGGASGHSSQNVPVWLYAPEKVKAKVLQYLGLPSDASTDKVRTGLFYDGTNINQSYAIQNSDLANAVAKAAGLMTLEDATEELFVPVYDDNNKTLYNYGTYDSASGVFTFSNGVAKVTKNSRTYIDKNGNEQTISAGLPIYLTNPVSYQYEDGSGRANAAAGKATAVFYMPKEVFDNCN